MSNQIDKSIEQTIDLVEFARFIINLCAAQCDPEEGFKYSPNSLSARADCKQKILLLLE